MSSEITRFNHVNDWGMERDEDGDYVLHSDYEAEVARLRAARDAIAFALAARQPVEFERAIPTRRRESAVELLLQLGFVWNNQRWEDRRQPVGVPAAWMHTHKATGRVEFGLSPMYDCDFNAVQWDSVALYAAPAQAVDLVPSFPSELAPVAAALKRFNECAEDCDSDGCDIGRDWFDALTTMGLLKRTQRSPAVWTMTAEGERLLALIDSQAVGNG